MNNEQPQSSASSSVLQEISEVLAKITPTPWVVRTSRWCIHVCSENGKFSTGCISFDGNGRGNAEFIAAAPRLLRRAQAEIEGLQREKAELELALSAQVAESRRLLRDRDAFWLSVEAAEARARENAEALLLAWGGVCPATWAIDPTNPMLMAERIRSRGDELQGQLEAAEARAEAAEGLNRELQAFAKDVAGWSLLMLSPEAQYAGIKRARELVARKVTTPPTTSPVRDAGEGRQKKCWHGHTKRVVGCVSCVIVFDRPEPPAMSAEGTRE